MQRLEDSSDRGIFRSVRHRVLDQLEAIYSRLNRIVVQSINQSIKPRFYNAMSRANQRVTVVKFRVDYGGVHGYLFTDSHIIFLHSQFCTISDRHLDIANSSAKSESFPAVGACGGGRSCGRFQSTVQKMPATVIDRLVQLAEQVRSHVDYATHIDQMLISKER